MRDIERILPLCPEDERDTLELQLRDLSTKDALLELGFQAGMEVAKKDADPCQG